MRRSAVFLLAPLLLAGCASPFDTNRFVRSFKPYRIDIVQGNVVTSEQIARVKPGMSRAQVRDALGTPLVTDPFHADRWDYIFTLQRSYTEPQRRTVTVYFDGDSLKSVDAPELPSERDFVASISPPIRVGERKLELTDAERNALPPPPKSAAAPTVPEPTGAVRDYPPLEAS